MVLRHDIRSVRDFEPIKAKWIKLERGSDMTVFQSYEWNILAYRQYINGIYNRLFSRIVVYEGENVIVPLIIQKISLNFRWIGRKKGIYFLGDGSYSDYLNLIYSDAGGDETAQLINYILNDNKDLGWRFSFIRDGNIVNRIIEENGIIPVHETVSVQVKLPKIAEDYDKMLSKSTRQNLRTALNRMKRDSINYELEIIEGVIDERLADDLIPIHLNRVLELNSHSTGTVNKISNWVRRRQLKHNETKNNIVNWSMKSFADSVLILCRLDGKIAGYLYGLKEDRRVRILQNCFVDEYKFYSPMFRGTYDFVMKEVKSARYECIDFTRGDEEYKYKLGGSEVRLYSYWIKGSIQNYGSGNICSN